jgi:hypothetical protein
LTICVEINRPFAKAAGHELPQPHSSGKGTLGPGEVYPHLTGHQQKGMQLVTEKGPAPDMIKTQTRQKQSGPSSNIQDHHLKAASRGSNRSAELAPCSSMVDAVGGEDVAVEEANGVLIESSEYITPLQRTAPVWTTTLRTEPPKAFGGNGFCIPSPERTLIMK